MSAGDPEKEPEFNLHVMWGSEVSSTALTIPIPVEYLMERKSVGLDELAASAIHRASLANVQYYHQRVAASLEHLHQLAQETMLEAQGPKDGYLFVVLPEDDPTSGEGAT